MDAFLEDMDETLTARIKTAEFLWTMRDFSFTWLWQDSTVDARAQELLEFFASKPRVVNMTLMYYAIHRYVGDTIALTYDSFVDQVMQIREISKDLKSGKTQVRALIYP